MCVCWGGGGGGPVTPACEKAKVKPHPSPAETECLQVKKTFKNDKKYRNA